MGAGDQADVGVQHGRRPTVLSGPQRQVGHRERSGQRVEPVEPGQVGGPQRDHRSVGGREGEAAGPRGVVDGVPGQERLGEGGVGVEDGAGRQHLAAGGQRHRLRDAGGVVEVPGQAEHRVGVGLDRVEHQHHPLAPGGGQADVGPDGGTPVGLDRDQRRVPEGVGEDGEHDVLPPREPDADHDRVERGTRRGRARHRVHPVGERPHRALPGEHQRRVARGPLGRADGVPVDQVPGGDHRQPGRGLVGADPRPGAGPPASESSV